MRKPEQKKNFHDSYQNGTELPENSLVLFEHFFLRSFESLIITKTSLRFKSIDKQVA